MPLDIKKLANIKALLLDVDGVLTNGQITYDDSGGEIKTFNVKDGLGIRMLDLAGIKTGIVTGRSSNALLKRCQNLRIEYFWDGVKEKSTLLPQISKEMGVEPTCMAFVGDDLPDIGLMAFVGAPIAVSDACEDVLSAACMVTTLPGGAGAVREVCEAILKARGFWNEIRSKICK